jgi:dihydroneopterin aldolase
VTGTSGSPPATAGDGEGYRGDLIQLRGLRASGVHGVLPEEKERAQPFEMDIDLSIDLSMAAGSDRLSDTVDYGDVADRAVGIVSGARSFDLLEALAGEVAEATLSSDRRIDAVTVYLRKLLPPLGVEIASVGVRITRNR